MSGSHARSDEGYGPVSRCARCDRPEGGVPHVDGTDAAFCGRQHGGVLDRQTCRDHTALRHRQYHQLREEMAKATEWQHVTLEELQDYKRTARHRIVRQEDIRDGMLLQCRIHHVTSREAEGWGCHWLAVKLLSAASRQGADS